VTDLVGRVDGRVQPLTVRPGGVVLDVVGRPVDGEVLYPSYDPTAGLVLGVDAALHLAAEEGRYAYHISGSHNRESIEAAGLTLQHSQDGKHVWLFPTEELARKSLPAWEPTRLMDGTLTTPDLYRVDISGMRTRKDPHRIAEDMGGVVVREPIPSHRLTRIASVEDETDEPSHAGVAMVAKDTGRVLMLQRSYADEEDPARGLWEFPGGGIEDDDADPFEGARREWAEEIGQPFPDDHEVVHYWMSPDGVYAGHVVVVPRESDVVLHEGRVEVNPDDPDGDDSEQAAWWEVEHARENPALRDEVADSPWDEIAAAAADAGGQQHAAALTPVVAWPHRHQAPADSWEGAYERGQVGGQMHQAMTVHLPPVVHDFVHDPSVAEETRGQVLNNYLDKANYYHPIWYGDWHQAHWNNDQNHYGDPSLPSTRVVRTALTPISPGSIEQDSAKLAEHGFWDPSRALPGRGVYPIREGNAMSHTGIRWGVPGGWSADEHHAGVNAHPDPGPAPDQYASVRGSLAGRTGQLEPDELGDIVMTASAPAAHGAPNTGDDDAVFHAGWQDGLRHGREGLPPDHSGFGEHNPGLDAGWSHMDGQRLFWQPQEGMAQRYRRGYDAGHATGTGLAPHAGSVLDEQLGDLLAPAAESGVDDDPEHALPVTYGEDEDPVLASLAQLAGLASVPAPDVAAGPDPRDPGYAVMAGVRPEHAWLLEGTGRSSSDEIADAAQAALAKAAHRDFAPHEQREIISEGEGGPGARNLAALDLADTHYEAMDPAAARDDEDWMFL
jgi:8-oxo-dGTP pyrophosphatase MutT (NUDIX family)